ncbi:hypothetical protein RYD26_12625, partial [Pasteurellaceae bacterium LIM206]|nr:hypothetical protein [Pasteurellaceae bacterium LIM206]
IRSSEHYQYDGQLNLTKKVQTQTDERGQYQLQAANDGQSRIKQHHGRIVRYGNKTYKYDEQGRLKTKTETKQGFRPVSTYYRWNSQSQLVEIQSPTRGTWRYEYDAFGRRTTKYQHKADQPLPNQQINMPIRPNEDYWHKIHALWDEQEAQNQQVQQNREKTPEKPTALLANATNKGYRYLYHANQLVAEVPLQINQTTTDGNTV